MTESVYWIWHQLLFGIASRRSHYMMELYSHPREIYEEALFSSGPMKPEERTRFSDVMENAKRLEYRTLKKGCFILTPEHPDYPFGLNDTYAKPSVIYGKGDASCMGDAFAITVVGTRRVTEYGRKAAQLISGGLARYGVLVVSGLAKGVDSASHMAVLEEGGKTVGVMGCGLDVDYPGDSAKIKRAISENGAVITEYPLGTKPMPQYFPQRNRIMAGMACGTVVVEAGVKSGALITAKLALDMGRDVFAVPGSIFSENNQGTNKLLGQGAAKAVGSADDILIEYPRFFEIKEAVHNLRGIGTNKNNAGRNTEGNKAANEGPARLPEIPEELMGIYGALDMIPKNVDLLTAQLGLPVEKVMSGLTELEILGLAQSHPGGYFTIA